MIELSITHVPASMQADLYKVASAKWRKQKQSMRLREFGRELDKRLLYVADIIDKLDMDGWTMRHFMDKTIAQHEDVATVNQATIRLRAMSIDPSTISINTTWNDWFASEPILEAT